MREKNKLESLLDCQATPSLIRRLVWAGVLPSQKFIRALVLCRDNSLLTRYGLQFLLLASLLYAISGFVLFLYAKWSMIPFSVKISSTLSLILLFSVLAWFQGLETRRGRIYLFISSFLVGPLLILIDRYYQTTDYSWSSFALWSILILPWTVISRSMLLYTFWLFLFNLVIFLWGYQVAFPCSYIAWPEFFSLLAVVNGIILAVREILVCFFKQGWLDKEISRLLPLIISLCFGIFPLIGYILGIKGSSVLDCGLIFFLLLTLASVVYFRVFPNLSALICLISSVCTLFLVFWFYQYITSMPYWYILFIFVLVIFGFSSSLVLKLKNITKS